MKFDFRAVLMLIFVLIGSLLITTNSDLYFGLQANNIDVNVDLNDNNQVSVTEEYPNQSYDTENDDQTWWNKVTRIFFKKELVISSEKDRIDLYNTDNLDLSDEDLIKLFGVKATLNQTDVPIKVTKEQISYNTIDVTFTTNSGENPEKSITGKISIIYNQKPIITVKKPKISIRKNKIEDLSDEELTALIIKKTGAQATDKEDENKDIKISVDLKNIKRDQKGEYQAQIIATDSAKQQSNKIITVNVK